MTKARLVLIPAVALIAALVLLTMFVRAIEPGFAFFPLQGETETPRDGGAAYQSVTVRTGDGEQLQGWVIPASTPRARILYFHGNGGNLSVWMPILVGIARQGYSVTAFDYRGYGLSSGRPSERGLQADVSAIVARFQSDRRPDLPAIYWGRSLGTALAAHAATIHAPDGIILEAGFPDARSLMRTSPVLALLGIFSSYRFRVVEPMARVKAPALVLHGDHDRVVPFSLGQSLFEQLPGPKKFVIVRGGDHNDASAPDPGSYWHAIDEFIRTTRR